MNLLVLNYSMNTTSSVFSHQSEVAIRLSSSFYNTFVITAENKNNESDINLSIFSSDWKTNQTFGNLLKFYRLVIPIIYHNRKRLVIFSHMTEVQSFLIAPITWLMGIPHYLWYAHKSKSPFLLLSFPFLTGVITSTPGSCPIRGHKVHPIGQAIDHEVFSAVKSIPKNPPLRWYHVGRMDQSKNIDVIIEVFQELRRTGWDVTLDLYGGPSAGISNHYYKKVLGYINSTENSTWLRYHGTVPRASLPEIAKLYDGFVHAFEGSLDKAVLEGAMSRRLVVSINNEFLLEFGGSVEINGTVSDRLLSQMLQTLLLSEEEQAGLIDKYWKVALEKHSLNKWTDKLLDVLLT